MNTSYGPSRIELPWGYIEFGNNEMSIVSTVDDPPKLRLASVGDSLGALSMCRLRPDGSLQEMVLLQGKVNEDGTPSGAMRLDVSDGGSEDANMHHILTTYHDRIEFFVPVVGGNPVQSDSLVASNNQYMTIQQADGNLVTYRRRQDGSLADAVWASGYTAPQLSVV